MIRVMFAVALIAGSLMKASGAEVEIQVAEEAVIRKAVALCVAIFNKGDAKTLAALWTPEAVYTNPLSGEQVVGRAAIEMQFAGIFVESKKTKLEASTTSINFISPGVAIELGCVDIPLSRKSGKKGDTGR